MMLRLGFVLFAALWISACHSQEKWIWRATPQPVRQAVPVALTVAPPALLVSAASVWSPVLEGVIAGQSHLRLDRKAWDYAVWASVDQETLAFTVVDRQGRILVAVSIYDTHYSDRQTGRALPDAARFTTDSLRELLLETFPAPAAVTNAGGRP